MDLHTANIFRLVKLSTKLHKHVRTHEIPLPRHAPNARTPYREYARARPVRIPLVDDDEPSMPFVIRQYLLLNHKWAPFRDDVEHWPDAQTAVRSMDGTFGAILPPADVDWGDPTPDEALWRWVTQGNCAQNLRRLQGNEAGPGEQGGFVVRCEYLSRFEVRAPFVPYGGDAYFDSSGKPTRIVLRGVEYKPGDTGWEAAKFAFRSSSFVGGSVSDHLVRCHLGWASALSLGAVKSLGKEHPLRRFLKPFMFKGAAITDLGSMLLLHERAWFHRVTGFTWKGLQECFDDAIAKNRLERFDEELKAKGMLPSTLPDAEMYPFGVEALPFWEVIDAFVTEAMTNSEALKSAMRAPHLEQTRAWWEDIRGAVLAPMPDLSQESLTHLLSIALFNVSAYHWHVQGIASYVRDPRFLSARLLPNQVMADRQAQTKLCMLTCVTGLPLPAIDGDITAHMPDEACRTAAGNLQNALRKLQTAMDARNGRRKQKYVLLEPRRVATSVGV